MNASGALSHAPVFVVRVAPTCGLPVRTGRVVLSGRVGLTWYVGSEYWLVAPLTFVAVTVTRIQYVSSAALIV